MVVQKELFYSSEEFSGSFFFFFLHISFSYLLNGFQCVIAAWLLPAKCKHKVPKSDGSDIFATVNYSYSYGYCCCYF